MIRQITRISFSCIASLFLLSACSASPTTVPSPTAAIRPTATLFPVVESPSVIYPTHESIQAPAISLPTSPPQDFIATMQAEVPEIECVPLLPDGWIWYEVQPGDILVGLAERARISVAELAQANCLDVNSELSARTLLFIPDERAP